MEVADKIELFKTLNTNVVLREDIFYDALDKCNALITNYYDYMTTAPIDCDAELRRVPDADYNLCCALLTMLLREDHFANGSFVRRQRNGQVKPIIERILKLLTSDDMNR